MVSPRAHHALPVGGMIEEFRIARVLGAGSFGIVYECQNTYLPETVAIKEFLPPELACRLSDGNVSPLSEQAEVTFRWARDRFLQEAKTLWELARPERHPNIVRVTRYCEANGTAYMFMELEQGRALSEILKSQHRISPRELDALLFPVLNGLERIHASGVLHRDIKPANILIRADGSPVLIDFGAARCVVAGGERSVVSAYTPVYAALEQYHDIGDQGAWTDIYSFGATLYQAVTGRKPLSASERLCGGVQATAAEDCAGLYPEPILNAIDWALAIKPEDRPRSVTEWRRCLAEPSASAVGYEPTILMSAAGSARTRVTAVPSVEDEAPAAPAVYPKPVPKEPVRRLGGKLALVASAMLLFIGAGIALYHRESLFPPPEPGPDDRERSEQFPRDDSSGRAIFGEPDPETFEPEPRPGDDSGSALVSADEAEPGSPGTTESGPPGGMGAGAEREETQRDTAGQGPPAPDSGPDVAIDTDSKGPTLPVEKPPERELVVAGTRFSDSLAGGGSGPVMVWLPGGEFQMGSPQEEAGRNPDERLHLVQVSDPFAVSETEITLGQFRRFVEETGYRTEVDRESTCLRPDESWQQLVPDMSLSWTSPGYGVTDRHPVTCVSWNDAEAYAAWLREKTGHMYRLPTEQEWEYAARAGTRSSRFWGDDPKAGCDYANTAQCDDDHTYSAPSGIFPPNPFGLRDVLGNLAEWTCSEYGKGYGGAESRCNEEGGASPRVFRGGSWLDAPELVRSAARDGAPANLGLNTVGFRLVRPAQSESGGGKTAADEVAKSR